MDQETIVNVFDRFLFKEAEVAREAAIRSVASVVVDQLADHPLAFTLERNRLQGPAMDAPLGWFNVGCEMLGVICNVLVPATATSDHVNRMAAILTVEHQLRDQLPEPDQHQEGV